MAEAASVAKSVSEGKIGVGMRLSSSRPYCHYLTLMPCHAMPIAHRGLAKFNFLPE